MVFEKFTLIKYVLVFNRIYMFYLVLILFHVKSPSENSLGELIFSYNNAVVNIVIFDTT